MIQRNQNLINNSFWETQSYFKDIDLVVVGSGIVGLSAAISYKEKHKAAKILVLERGFLPTGASTKNAGFACFGSISELNTDIKNTSTELVFKTVEMRIKGLEILRSRLGDKHIDFQKNGGYELFDNLDVFENCVSSIKYFNKEMTHFTKTQQTYKVNSKKISEFGFHNIKGIIKNSHEGQIDTGKMMQHLIQFAIGKGVVILNNMSVTQIKDSKTDVIITTPFLNIKCNKVIIATNGFANELLNIKDLKPARAQVLVTEPIPNLNIKGTFHYNEGYIYFRNIGNRILLGGARNLDFELETTSVFELNSRIQNYLTQFLKTTILPNQKVKIEQRWTGIMGVGSEKMPIVKNVSTNVVCAVRLGGMGVAIGSLIGQQAANKFN